MPVRGRKSAKHGKNKQYSTYGRNTKKVHNMKPKFGCGYHGPRGQNTPEYQTYYKKKCEFYSNKTGSIVF